MRDTRYGVFFSLDRGAETRMHSLGDSGSPSAMWGRLRLHLGHPKATAVSLLKSEGYAVRELPPAKKVEDSPPTPKTVEEYLIQCDCDHPARWHTIAGVILFVTIIAGIIGATVLN